MGAAINAQWEVLTDKHREVVNRIEEATTVSQNSVLRVGSALAQVVESALKEEAQFRDVLDELQQDPLDPEIAENAEAHARDLMTKIRAQFKALIKGKSHVQTILAASDELARAGRASEILALNARIHINSLEDRGSFDAVSDSLRRLNEQMNGLRSKLEQLLFRTVNMLSALEENNRQLSRKVGAFQSEAPATLSEAGFRVTRAQTSLQTILGTPGDATALAGILSASHEALAHMQYQDPMIQQVQRIDSLVAEALTEGGKKMGLGPVQPVKYHPNLSERKPPVADGEEDDDAGESSVEARREGELLMF